MTSINQQIKALLFQENYKEITDNDFSKKGFKILDNYDQSVLSSLQGINDNKTLIFIKGDDTSQPVPQTTQYPPLNDSITEGDYNKLTPEDKALYEKTPEGTIDIGNYQHVSAYRKLNTIKKQLEKIIYVSEYDKLTPGDKAKYEFKTNLFQEGANNWANGYELISGGKHRNTTRRSSKSKKSKSRNTRHRKTRK